MTGFGSFKIRFDPWSADYGASLMSTEESDFALLQKVRIDTTVEMPEEAWQPVYCDPREADPDSCKVAFIDGVRRMECNLVFEGSGDAEVPHLSFLYGGFGCCAAGAIVLSHGRMNEMEESLKVCSVQRFLFAPEDSGFGESFDIAQSYPPGSTLPHQVILLSGIEPQDPLRRLQQLMRQEEALVVEQVAAEDAALVIADGPLNLPLIRTDVAGFIKSLHSFYIPSTLFPVLTRIKKHERTPLFLLSGEDVMERYSAYVRINEPRPQDTILAGIARFEVAGSAGKEAATAILNRCAALVPLFASPYGRDPRAPQNLLPIAALEIELRRRLGSQQILNRFYQEALASPENR